MIFFFLGTAITKRWSTLKKKAERTLENNKAIPPAGIADEA
jgi:hypothetical protein